MRNSPVISSSQAKRGAFLLLALFALLSLFTSGKWVVAPFVWIAPIFALRFMRGQKVWPGVVLIWLAIFIPSIVSWYKLQPFPMLEYLIFMAVAALFGVLPLLVDRLLTPHLGSRFAATLIFPLAVTTTEYVTMSGANPMGSFGAQGYTQYGLPIIMQLAALTGLWGITFLTNWFASVVNWAWGQHFNWSQIRRGVAVFGAVLLLVVVYGGGRLFFALEPADTVTIASFTVEETHPSELFALLEADEVAFRDKTTEMHAGYLKQTVQAARNGAHACRYGNFSSR